MHLRRIRRHPSTRWAVAVVLAAVTALTVSSSLRAGEAARRAWGATRSVLVATHDIEAGAVVGGDDVAARRWPAALVPPGAASGAVVGRTARADIAAGEVVVDDRLAPPGRAGSAALVPAGWRVLAVAVGPATVAVAPGDVVDLYATGDPTAGPQGAADLVAEGAVVVSVGEGAVSVAVPDARVAGVASAAATGTVTVVGRP